MIRGIFMSNASTVNQSIITHQFERIDYKLLHNPSNLEAKPYFISYLEHALDSKIDAETIAVSIKRGLLRSGTDQSHETARLVQQAFQGKSDELVDIINDFTDNIARADLGARQEHVIKPFQISVAEGRELFLKATAPDVYSDIKKYATTPLTRARDKLKLAFYAFANDGLDTMIRGRASDYLPKQQGTEEKSSIDLG